MAGLIDFQKLQEASPDSRSIMEDSLKNFDTEQFRFAKLLLDNDEKNIDQELMAKFWPFFDREMTLTNFTDKDIQVMMDELRISTINQKMSVPDFSKTYDDIRNWDELRPKFFAKIKRSTGGMERERALISTQIKQFLTNEVETAKGGILSKISGIFGGRK